MLTPLCLLASARSLTIRRSVSVVAEKVIRRTLASTASAETLASASGKTGEALDQNICTV
jgi:hypothetical protein